MTQGGFAPPTAAMSTQQLTQAYNPFGQQQQMTMGQAPALPAANIAGMVGEYTPEMEAEWARKSAIEYPAMTTLDLGGVQDDVTVPPPEGADYTDPEGTDGYTLHQTAVGVSPDGEVEFGDIYVGPDGNSYDINEDGQYIRTQLAPGELMDQSIVDDYTYGKFMEGRGIDVGDKFELSEFTEPDYERFERQYDAAQADYQAQIGAASRAFQEHAARTGIASSPTAMAGYQGQLTNEFAKAGKELDDWLEDKKYEEYVRASDRLEQETDGYKDRMNQIVDNWITTSVGTGGPDMGFAPAFIDYIHLHAARWVGMGMHEDQIRNMLPMMKDMWVEETGRDPWEDMSNQVVGTMSEYMEGSEQTMYSSGYGTGTHSDATKGEKKDKWEDTDGDGHVDTLVKWDDQ